MSIVNLVYEYILTRLKKNGNSRERKSDDIEIDNPHIQGFDFWNDVNSRYRSSYFDSNFFFLFQFKSVNTAKHFILLIIICLSLSILQLISKICFISFRVLDYQLTECIQMPHSTFDFAYAMKYSDFFFL